MAHFALRCESMGVLRGEAWGGGEPTSLTGIVGRVGFHRYIAAALEESVRRRSVDMTDCIDGEISENTLEED